MKQQSLWPDKDKSETDPLGWRDNRPGSVKKSEKKKFRSKEEYYKSPEWEQVRVFAIHRANHRCQRCGSAGVLQVHHVTYDNLFNEKPEDLEALCKRCHDSADRQRAEGNRRDNAFETYMTKKYGEDWEWSNSCDEEFDNWYERKREMED
jgi:5-methylcytosine-specific restriction endonuclease McrA